MTHFFGQSSNQTKSLKIRGLDSTCSQSCQPDIPNGCFTYPWDIFHMSIWERKCLERGAPLKKKYLDGHWANPSVIFKTSSQIPSPPVEPLDDGTRNISNWTLAKARGEQIKALCNILCTSFIEELPIPKKKCLDCRIPSAVITVYKLVTASCFCQNQTPLDQLPPFSSKYTNWSRWKWLLDFRCMQNINVFS